MTLGVMSLLLNLLITGLLMATISYCWVLNRRIKILQDSKSELSSLLKYFDESTTRASETIIALQSASKKIGENIQVRIDKANFVMDDLNFMIDKGNRLADQLDANFAVNRARSRVNVEPIKEPEIANEQEEEFLPRHNLKPQPVLEKKSEKTAAKSSASASIEAVLDRVIGRVKPAAGRQEKSPEKFQEKSDSNNRSKAEKELLDMIRAGIKG